MEIRYAAHPNDVKSYDTSKLRAEFISTDIMEPSNIKLVYTHYDRFIYGGVSPVWEPLNRPNTMRSRLTISWKEGSWV